MDTTNIVLIITTITIWVGVATIIWGHYDAQKSGSLLRDTVAEIEYAAAAADAALAARQSEVEAVEAHIWDLVREYREVNVTIYRPDEKECEAVEIRPHHEKETTE